MPSPSHKLAVKEKFGYGLGDTASNIFYYTDVFGISAAAAGWIFAITRIWDAINDPLMGALADRTNSKHGKYRPYLLWMSVPFGLFGYLVYANPAFSGEGKVVYALLTYVSFMMAYTAINVPYSALMGMMSPDPVERTSLSTYRFVGAFSGMLIVSMTVRPMVRELGNGNEALGYQLTMGVCALLAVILFFITFLTTKERVKPIQNTGSLKKDFGYLLQNTPWIIMVVAALLTLSNVGLRSAITPHYFKYFVGDQGEEFFWFLDKTSLLLTTGSIAFIVGVFFTNILSKTFGKRNSLIVLTLLNGFTVIAFYFIPADAYMTMLAVNALGNLLAGPTPALVWAIYTDVVDYGEWKHGRRTPGLAFSLAMFAQKMGLTIGAAVGAWLLGFYGFVANTDQSDETLQGIRLLFCVIPGVLGLANGVVLFWYRLSDEELATIVSDLEERRGNQEKI